MLTSLEIKNFRCLEDLQVQKLGRVNLIVGNNNSGKSTVLEALRIYAGNAQRGLLEQIAAEHDEKFRLRDSETSDADTSLPFEDLFTGRKFPDSDNVAICIGPMEGGETLRIEHGFLLETEEVIVTNDLAGTLETSTRIRRQRIPKPSPEDSDAGNIRQALFTTKGERSTSLLLDGSPRYRTQSIETVGTLPCSAIPTQFVSIDELADAWDKIVFTEHEDTVKKALRIISSEFEALTFVRSEDNVTRREFRRSAKVKLSNVPRPVPLNSLGDGMLRVLQLLLKVFPAKGGFLLIDEFENGLHYSVQEKVWALLFEIAQKLDIQIFATTHSWDCIESFTKAALDRIDIDGLLFRVGKSVRNSDNGKVIATVFDESALHSITQADMEVR